MEPQAPAPTPAPTPADPLPPMRRSRLRRWLVGSAFAFAALVFVLAVALVAGWQALGTDTGTAWLLSQVSGLKIVNGHGSLRGGPFSAAHVEFDVKDGPVRVSIDGLQWKDLRWRWRPYTGAWTALVIEGLQAQRVEIRTRPGTSKGSTAPPRSLRLPIELELRDARVQALQINDAAPLRELSTRLHLGAEQGRVHQVEQLAFAWDRLRLSASGQMGTEGTLPLEARAELQSQPLPGATGPLATAWAAKVDARGPLQRLALDGQLRALPGPQAIGASLDLHTVLAPFAPWPLAELKARMQQLDLATLASTLPSTRLDGSAELSSTGMDQPAGLRLQLDNALAGRWDEARLPVRHVQLELQGKPSDHRQLELRTFAVRLGSDRQPGGELTGQGRWTGDAFSLQARLSAVQPASLDQRLAAMSLSGPVELQVHGLPVPGAASAPQPAHWQADWTTRLEGRLQAAGALPVRLESGGHVEAKGEALKVELRELAATAGSARASAQALAQWPGQGPWQLSSRGELAEFDPLPWWPGADGSAWRQGGHRLNATWDAELAWPTGQAAAASLVQQLQALRGKADVAVTNSRLAGVPLEARLRLRNEGKALALSTELQAAGNKLKLEGQLGDAADGSTDQWRVEADAAALAALAPLVRLAPALAAWEPKAGQLKAMATAQGRWPQLRSDGQLRLDGLKAGTATVAQAEARWQVAQALDAPLQVHADASGLSSGLQRAERLRLDVTGTPRAHRIELRLDTAAKPPAWADPLLGRAAGKPTSLQLAADGAWQPDTDGGRWRTRVQRLRGGPTAGSDNAAWFVADGLQLDLGWSGSGALQQASAQPGQLQLLGASLRWRDMRWQAASAGVPPKIAVQAELEPMQLAPILARLQPDFGWGGDLVVEGRAEVSTGSTFRADVVLQRRSGDLTVTDEGGTQTLGLTDLRVGLNADGGVWHFTEVLAGSTVGVLAGAQSLRLSPQAVWPAPQTPMEGVLELRVDNLGVWGPWTPPGWRLAGSLHTSATLGGRFGAPEYTGRLEGRGIGARNLLQGVNVTDGDVLIALKGPTAQIERFTMKGGEGVLRLEGNASFGEAPRAQVSVNAGHFQLLGRVDRRIVASGQAQLALDAEAIKLDGRFVVDEGLVDFSRSDAPTLDDDVTVVHRSTARGSSSTAAAAAEEAEAPPPPKPPRQTQMTLNVDLGERLHIRGRGLDAFLRGQLRMTTPGGRLNVTGAVRSDNGTYQAYGQKLEIERGLLDFIGPVENPRLDIIALRPNLDVRVGVSVGGTALKPRVRLFSEPEMSDTDKLSWLVLGRAPEGLGRSDTALLQHAAMALLSGEGGSTTDRVMQALGLDDFSVRQEGEGDVRNTVVSLGKQLSRRWYVGYERGVSSTTGAWQLIYRIAQRFTLRAQAGQDNALDVIWTWRWN